MLPGGIVDPGETLDRAVEREVLEETGVSARAIGVCGIRTRRDDLDNDTYVIFLLEAGYGMPRSDGRENDDARFFSLEELDGPEVTNLSSYFGRRALTGALTLLEPAVDFDISGTGREPEGWKLYC
jgi:8-oxo-dGTP diphosphatase